MPPEMNMSSSMNSFVPYPSDLHSLRALFKNNNTSLFLACPSAKLKYSSKVRPDKLPPGYEKVLSPSAKKPRACFRVKDTRRVVCLSDEPGNPYLVRKKGGGGGLPTLKRRDLLKKRKDIKNQRRKGLHATQSESIVTEMDSASVLHGESFVDEERVERTPFSDDKIADAVDITTATEAETTETPALTPQSVAIAAALLQSKLRCLPTDLFAVILSYMPSPVVFEFVFETFTQVHSTLNTDMKAATEKAINSGSRLRNIVSSLFISGSFRQHWRESVISHRLRRAAALDGGDLHVEVEKSSFPTSMGEVDRDLPVWKKEWDENDLLMIDREDRKLCKEHLRMLQSVIARLMDNPEILKFKLWDLLGESENVFWFREEEEVAEKEEEVEGAEEVEEGAGNGIEEEASGGVEVAGEEEQVAVTQQTSLQQDSFTELESVERSIVQMAIDESLKLAVNLAEVKTEPAPVPQPSSKTEPDIVPQPSSPVQQNPPNQQDPPAPAPPKRNKKRKKRALLLPPSSDPNNLPPLCLLELFGLTSSAVTLALKAITISSSPRTFHQLRSISFSGMKHIEKSSLLNIFTHSSLASTIARVDLDGVLAVNKEVCEALGNLENVRFLDLSNCRNVDNDGLRALFVKSETDEGGKEISPLAKSVEFLSIANASKVTDEGLRSLTPLRYLTDLCIFGCFKLTDSGIYHLGQLTNLIRFNYCGAYKISEASRRYLFSQNQTLLIYNSVVEFGKLWVEKEKATRVRASESELLTDEELFLKAINQ